MADNTLVIKPQKGLWNLDLRELWIFRELLFFFVWRDIKVRYKQTLIGASWAIIQPFLTMIVFTIFFGRIAGIEEATLSDGIPYPIFSYSGLLLWIYFSTAVTNSGNSLVGNYHIITKIYFPRIYIPLTSGLAGIVDYLIAFVLLILMMIYYGLFPNWNILLLPVVVFFAFISALGFGLWLSALNVRYRDVRYVIPFFIQLMMFASPVIYPPEIFPSLKWLLDLNPMSGIIQAHRSCLLGVEPINWISLSISVTVAMLIFISGIVYFEKTERFFADII